LRIYGWWGDRIKKGLEKNEYGRKKERSQNKVGENEKKKLKRTTVKFIKISKKNI